MKIVIGADHGGFELKENIKKYLQSINVDFKDIGNHVYNDKDDYPDFAIPVAKKVASGEFDRGIIICGSGVGACVAANKIKGVRACVCHDLYSAAQGVEHDDMNVLCLGGRIIDFEQAKALINAFLNAKFSNLDRHINRLVKVIALEREE
jgi:ribose 5-phosphate isomerase B